MDGQSQIIRTYQHMQLPSDRSCIQEEVSGSVFCLLWDLDVVSDGSLDWSINQGINPLGWKKDEEMWYGSLESEELKLKSMLRHLMLIRLLSGGEKAYVSGSSGDGQQSIFSQTTSNGLKWIEGLCWHWQTWLERRRNPCYIGEWWEYSASILGRTSKNI